MIANITNINANCIGKTNRKEVTTFCRKTHNDLTIFSGDHFLLYFILHAKEMVRDFYKQLEAGMGGGQLM